MLAKRLARRIDQPAFPGWAVLAAAQPGATVTTYDANWAIDPLAAAIGARWWMCATWTASNATGLVIASLGLADTLVVGAGVDRTDVATVGNGGRVRDGVRPFAAGSHPVTIAPGADGYGNNSFVGSLRSGPSGLAYSGYPTGAGGDDRYGVRTTGLTSPITGQILTYAPAGDPTRPGGGGVPGGTVSGAPGIVIVRVPIG